MKGLLVVYLFSIGLISLAQLPNYGYNYDCDCQYSRMFDYRQVNGKIVVEEHILECAPFVVVEEVAYFTGPGSYYDYFAAAPYPLAAQDQKLEGDVTISFVISKRGIVDSVKLVSSSGYNTLDDTALNHIMAMPAWSPAKQRGKPVVTRFECTIRYKLGTNNSKKHYQYCMH